MSEGNGTPTLSVTAIARLTEAVKYLTKRVDMIHYDLRNITDATQNHREQVHDLELWKTDVLPRITEIEMRLKRLEQTQWRTMAALALIVAAILGENGLEAVLKLLALL